MESFSKKQSIQVTIYHEQSSYEDFLENTTINLTPNAHSFDELIDHLIAHYHATPYTLDSSYLLHFKNMILDQHLYTCSNHPSVTAVSDLIVKAYTLNYKNASNIRILLEMKTESLRIQNGPEALCHELTLWLGITQEDIKKRTPRFYSYIHSLKNASE